MELKNNEIDLLHLIGILWRSKKVIGTMVLLFAVVGFFISALLPQKWTSQAEITPAENIQWSELQKTLMTLQVLDVKTEIKTEDVFHLFLKKFMSQSLKEEFLSTSPLVLGKLQEQNIDSEELRRALVLVAGKIKATNNASPAKGDETLYDSWTLAFTAPTPPEAQQVLQSYIDFIAGKVVKETLDSLRNKVELKKSFEKNVLEMDRVRIANRHDSTIKRLNYSLEVANAAGIKRPVYSNGMGVQDDPDFSIALGSDGISEKLKIERSMTDLTELNAEFRNREYKLEELQKVAINDIDFSPLKYQRLPSLPMKNDGPGKIIILALAAIFGLIISSTAVLVRHGSHQRNQL